MKNYFAAWLFPFLVEGSATPQPKISSPPSIYGKFNTKKTREIKTLFFAIKTSKKDDKNILCAL